MVAVERKASGAAAVEDKVVGVYANWIGDEHGVTEHVDESDQTRSGVSGRAGRGDRHSKLLRLYGGADRIDGTDDRAVGVAATDGEGQSG